jgi:hypothetical protein
MRIGRVVTADTGLLSQARLFAVRWGSLALRSGWFTRGILVSIIKNLGRGRSTHIMSIKLSIPRKSTYVLNTYFIHTYMQCYHHHCYAHHAFIQLKGIHQTPANRSLFPSLRLFLLLRLPFYLLKTFCILPLIQPRKKKGN